jgi:Ran GTPase-activating protein (RanGAP) involved in mRNA processing and transport
LLGSTSADFLYQCLKPHTNLVVLDVSNNVLSVADAKAIGKVLTDFKGIRELNVNNAGLNQ